MSFIQLLLILAAVVVLAILYKKFSALALPWSANIEQLTLGNTNWRKVEHTTPNMQIVTMSVPARQELGMEVHSNNDQFFRVERGNAELVTKVGDSTKKFRLSDGDAAVVPSKVYHNLINTGDTDLKLYTIYAPPHHPPGTIDATHADEIAREK